jgi:Mg-chelatase subunit ChlI
MDQEKLTDAVIVHGPQGCGKTRHAEALAAHFGVGRVVDEWMPGDPVEPDALHLSQVEVPGAVSYESLKAELRLA